MQVIDKDFLYGKLVTAYDKYTLTRYNNWRTKYYDKPGLIHYFHVTDYTFDEDFNDFDMIAIYINDPGNELQPYLKTSAIENVEVKDNKLIATTLNSVYEFELGDFDITEENKMELAANIIFR